METKQTTAIPVEGEISTPQNEKESSLERFLKRIRRTDDFPGISRYLIQINEKISSDSDAFSASELANFILKDFGLTHKLLKLVNSAFYGGAAGKVTTVTRAVVMLGFENIRMATLSLVLFEHFKSKSNVTDLKEIIVGSFWAGMMARDIAKMDDGLDPEEAFVCAMMSQLGKLLMIYYQPDKYRKICARVQNHGENETKAAKTVCDFTFDELGMAVAKQWNLPPKIINSMPTLTQTDLENKKKPPEKIQALCSFVKEISNVIQSGDLLEDNQNIAELINIYKSRVKISKDQIKSLMKGSLGKVEKHANVMQFNLANSTFLNKLANFFDPGRSRTAVAAADANSTEMKVESDSFKLADLTELKAGKSAKNDKNPKDIIMEGIQEISVAMMDDLDMNSVAMMSLEVLYRALDFNRALMFVREAKGQMMTVRYGYGNNVQNLIRKVEFKPAEGKDLFNLSIKTGKDLIVANAADPKLIELLPAWYRNNIDAPAFIFLPVLFKNVCIGAFYADRDKNGVPISETEHSHLSMLRNQLILAIKFR